MMNQMPAFIGGCPRSGTTALQQLLNTNPNVYITSEENLLNTIQIMSKLLGTRERRQEVYKKGMRATSVRETIDTNTALESNFTSQALWPSIMDIYRWHHKQLVDTDPLILWGDKLPDYYKNINQILKIPGAKYIHITRNPLDVINSMLQRSEMARQGKDWWKAITELDGMIEAWANAYHEISLVEENSAAYHMHYEDLIFNYDETICSLSEFLGVECSYDNILVSDRDKHFHREYLSDEIVGRICSNQYVKKYFDSHDDNYQTNDVKCDININDSSTNANEIDEELIRVYIASSPAEWLPARVLEYSIREATSNPVQVMYLYQSDIIMPIPADDKNKPRTPFSFQRFLIPELCGYSGKAIYLDSDMLVFKDIDDLWKTSLTGCDIQATSNRNDNRREQFSVMLLDCSSLEWDVKNIVKMLDSGEISYTQLMYEMRLGKQIKHDISSVWNSLEHYDDETALLHYTDMNTQPWVSTENQLEKHWFQCLMRSIKSDFISVDNVRDQVTKGHVRPSLLAQLESNLDWSSSLPISIAKLDRSFQAPYKSIKNPKNKLWIRMINRLKIMSSAML